MVVVIFLSSLPTRASSTVSHTGNCTPAAATSCTLTATPSFGSLLISKAYRSNSATAPTTAAGWIVIKTTTGNTNSIKVAYKFSLGNESTCGTWTNATATDCDVYSGVDIQSGGPVGTATSGTTGSSTTISYPTFTLNNTSGSSWVACSAGAVSATNADVAPTGMTLRSGTTLNNFASSDTNAGVTSWSTQTVTVSPTGSWASACWEILGQPATSGVSGNLVRHFFVGMAGESCTGICNFTIPFPGSSGANNLLKLAIMWGYTTTAPTISNIYCNSDTGHATWTWVQESGLPVLDTTDTTDATIYDIVGSPAGCTSVTVVFSSVFNNVTADFTEWRQIATSSAIDTSTGQSNAGTGPNFTGGAMTTGTSGDVIYQFCSTAPLSTGFGTSTGAFAGDSALVFGTSISFGVTSEAFTQTSSGSITPFIQFQGTANLSGVCVESAMKTSTGAGTAVSGAQIISESTETFGAVATQHIQTAILNNGDTITLAGNSGALGTTSQNFTGITDTLGNSYTIKQNSGGSNNVPAFAFDSNSTAGNDFITLTGNAVNGNGTYTVVEMSGMKNSSHTASFDSTMGFCSNTGGSSPYSSAPGPCTPSTSNGILLATMTDGVGPATAITSPSGAIYAYPNYTGITDISFMTEGGGYSYLYNSSASAVSWTWTNANSSSWAASAIAFEAASIAAKTCTMTLLGVGPC